MTTDGFATASGSEENVDPGMVASDTDDDDGFIRRPGMRLFWSSRPSCRARFTCWRRVRVVARAPMGSGQELAQVSHVSQRRMTLR